MPDIYRGYTPTVVTTQPQFFQQSLATATNPRLLQTNVDPRLPHRKIWPFLFSVTAGVAVNWDLVATLNSREVFRLAMSRYKGTSLLYSIGWQAVSTNIGAVSEQLFIFVAQSTLYSVSPLRLNIAADTFFIDSTAGGGISGGGSLWDGYLFTMSQAGI